MSVLSHCAQKIVKVQSKMQWAAVIASAPWTCSTGALLVSVTTPGARNCIDMHSIQRDWSDLDHTHAVSTVGRMRQDSSELILSLEMPEGNGNPIHVTEDDGVSFDEKMEIWTLPVTGRSLLKHIIAPCEGSHLDYFLKCRQCCITPLPQILPFTFSVST